MNPDDSPDLRNRLIAIHRELGIPENYAAERRLQVQAEAGDADLVDIGLNPDGRVVRLLPAAADAWVRLRRAAAGDGELMPISGFRSIERQAEIIREKLASGQPIEQILRVVAAPGFSEHHTGHALDIGSPDYIELNEHFAETPAFRWLTQHAGDFGFRLSFPRNNPHGIVYEPWHWCWRGQPD